MKKMSTKPEHGLRNPYSNAFSTKLSLPKFMSVSKLLTPEQRCIVESIGFHHLLDIRCDSVPRSICLWLAKNFDVKSRCLHLADGSRFPVTSQSIHLVLGIPNGGKQICKICDESVKKLIADETSCKGKTPTINELKALLTPELVGDKFKRIFTLFTIGCLLCPTSYDCISTDYYSAVQFSEEISSYDWCTAVLDKLSDSIEFFQRTVTNSSTTTLGGCILALVIIYFELLNMPHHAVHEVVPRLKFWSTDMIKAFQILDAKDLDGCIFGRLPLKPSKESIALTSAISTGPPTGSSEMSIKCNSVSCSFKNQFASLSQIVVNEMVSAIEPILSHFSDRMHAAWHCSPETTRQGHLVPVQKVDCDKSVTHPQLTAACISEIIPQHLSSSVLLKNKDEVTANSESLRLLKDKNTIVGKSNSQHLDSLMSVKQKITRDKSASSLLARDKSVSQQIGCSLVKEKDKVVVNTESSVVVKVEDIVLGTSVSEPIESSMYVKDPVSSRATSSILDLPSFSQDSSNTCSFDVSAASHDVCTQLKPLILKKVECSKTIFPCKNVAVGSDQKGDSFAVTNDPKLSDLTTPESPQNGNSFAATNILQPSVLPTLENTHNAISIAAAVEPQSTTLKNGENVDSYAAKNQPQTSDLKTPEKSTADLDFDFFGHGLDSDFEVRPLPQLGLSEMVDQGSSSRKRPRSLNEAVLQMNLSRRLLDGSSNRNSLVADNIVHNGGMSMENLIQSDNSIDLADAELIDHVSQLTPCKPLTYHINFTSTLVEKEVFKVIVDQIPYTGKRPRVVQIKKNWVDHKTFGLSMQVYGKVSSYVIDVMGRAVMTEEFEKNKANLLPGCYWYRHIVQIEKGKLLQRKDADSQSLSKHFIAPNHGYRLDSMSMVFIPVFYDQYWYLVVANLRNGKFEVLMPNQLFEEIERDAECIILNFKRMFNYACPHSRQIHIWEMETAYRSVTNTQNHCDSGIFIMKLMKSHDGESQHLFKPEEAKALRESLSYYLLTHPYNDKFDSLVDIKKILSIQGVQRNASYC